MEYRISNLLISLEELSDSSGIQIRDIYEIREKLSRLKVIFNNTAGILKKKILLIYTVIILFWSLISFLITGFSFSFVTFFFFIWCASISYFCLQGYLMEMHNVIRTISQYQNFYELYIELENFNTLVENIDAINVSEESGGSNKLENKDKVYSILKTLRADLILALKFERNCRENPNFTFNNFDTNKIETSLFNIQEEYNQYGKTLSQAIQISINVAEEMQKLNR